ncbi:envelope-like protein [Cucumis melo var. makuwa]|uniref:Envelope-like protein n=1 Tax=Cucumis melo var. makuwa TaxID=1194695 RepID=A0A5A7VL39_CUCMM|nr:envelope-like protein [Cucumis melo var. makuwa]TYK26015.1 envelope-like protein [Cucumis melo var. makuwa]
MTIEQLVLELSGELVRNWLTDDKFSISKLSVKYAILHKIGIGNWYMSTHRATISTALAQLIYQIDSSHVVDVGEFVFQQILRHVDTYGINIPICFPRLINDFLLSYHSDLLIDDDVAGSTPRAELSVPDSGLHLSRDLVLPVIQLLSNESRALTVCVADLQCAISTLTDVDCSVSCLLICAHVEWLYGWNDVKPSCNAGKVKNSVLHIGITKSIVQNPDRMIDEIKDQKGDLHC